MTTLVIVVKNDVAALAADTLTTFGSTKLPGPYKADHHKILKIGHNLVGVCGNSAHPLALASVLKKEKKLDLSSRQAIFDTFRRLHPVLKEEYFLNPKEEDDDPYESSQFEALIANKHGIFSVHSYREVFAYERFWAAGSGYRFALGAAHALYDRLDSAAEIAKAAVLAGCVFDTSSSAPVVVESVKLESA